MGFSFLPPRWTTRSLTRRRTASWCPRRPGMCLAPRPSPRSAVVAEVSGGIDIRKYFLLKCCCRLQITKILSRRCLLHPHGLGTQERPSLIQPSSNPRPTIQTSPPPQPHLHKPTIYRGRIHGLSGDFIHIVIRNPGDSDNYLVLRRLHDHLDSRQLTGLLQADDHPRELDSETGNSEQNEILQNVSNFEKRLP